MDERRKRAYRYLLYYAMLDIRPLAWMPFGFWRLLNPFGWRATSRRVRRAGVIADWLHNLAPFSALDFQRFDEEWFWRDLRNCADRHPDLEPIGACGLHDFQADRSQSHRAEVGYWLAKPFWGRGVMTAVVRRVCRHAFEDFGLAKLTAHVFPRNLASARVLEKCGFQQEGFLRQHFLKDGRFLDARLFGLLR